MSLVEKSKLKKEMPVNILTYSVKNAVYEIKVTYGVKNAVYEIKVAVSFAKLGT